jgi:aminopeptidase N
MEKTYGKERLNEGMKSARDRVLRSLERSPGPVIDTTITDLMKLLSANSYQKGAWVLHMLRQETGDENFWKGMRLFYERFRNKNALTADFEKVMVEVSKLNLDKFFYQWLYISGQPDLKITKTLGKKIGFLDVTIEQKQNYLFTFNLDIDVKDKKGVNGVKATIKDRITKITVKGEPDAEIVPDPEVKLLFRVVEN